MLSKLGEVLGEISISLLSIALFCLMIAFCFGILKTAWLIMQWVF